MRLLYAAEYVHHDDPWGGRSAVQHWRFIPARQGSQPLEAWVVVPFKFRLTGADAPS